MPVLSRVEDKHYIFPAQPIPLSPESDLFKALNNDDRYVAEPKKNGWRCLVRITPEGKIVLWTRRRSVITDPLPNIRGQLKWAFEGENGYIDACAKDSILDGELMGHRGQAKDQLVLWGVYRWGGKWMTHLTYEQTYQMVSAGISPELQNVKVALQVTRDKVGFYHRVMAGEFGPGNEGIVIKNLGVPVPFGWHDSVEHRQWFKVKPLGLINP